MEKRVENNDFKELDLKDNEELIQAIENAKIEWECAKSCFENVNKDLLVDYAIFKERSTRAKYTYLLRIAKQKDVRTSNIFAFR